MLATIQIYVEGTAEDFVNNGWPELLKRLGVTPQAAWLDDENVSYALSIAPPEPEAVGVFP